MAEIILLPHLENKQTPYGNFTFGFDFELSIAIGMWFCTDAWILSELDDHWQSYDVMYIFQDGGHMAAIPWQIYFRFLIYDVSHLEKQLKNNEPNTKY